MERVDKLECRAATRKYGLGDIFAVTKTDTAFQVVKVRDTDEGQLVDVRTVKWETFDDNGERRMRPVRGAFTGDTVEGVEVRHGDLYDYVTVQNDDALWFHPLESWCVRSEVAS